MSDLSTGTLLMKRCLFTIRSAVSLLLFVAMAAT